MMNAVWTVGNFARRSSSSEGVMISSTALTVSVNRHNCVPFCCSNLDAQEKMTTSYFSDFECFLENDVDPVNSIISAPPVNKEDEDAHNRTILE